MNIILGLDVSTSCIGLTLAANVEKELKIIQVTHFRLKTPSKIKGIEALFHKSAYFETVLNNYKDLSKFGIDKLKINHVIIEEPLIGSNNAFTASTLLRFNGMISQSVFNILNVIPEFISSFDARKYSFPELLAVRKYNKSGKVYPVGRIRKSLKNGELVLFGEYPWDCDKKLILQNKISDMFPDINWQYDKNGELKKENFDASDSLVCVLGYVHKNNMEKSCVSQIIEFTETSLKEGVIFNYKVQFGDKMFDKLIELNE